MAVVIDANLLVSICSGDPRGDRVLEQFLEWLDQKTELHSPWLAHYEFANALTRLIVAKAFRADKVADAWNSVSVLPITFHSMVNPNRTVEIALMLSRQNAYDAAYLALTESLGAELYTLDGSLYRNAIGHGFKIKLIQ